MIHYALSCDDGHAFDAWFSSGNDYDRQRALRLVTCPTCSSADVSKSLMTPSVSTARKKEATQTLALAAAQREAIRKLKEAISEIRANSEDVGERFAEEARRIHYGETEVRGIIGQATPEDARALFEEGIEVAVLPDDVN